MFVFARSRRERVSTWVFVPRSRPSSCKGRFHKSTIDGQDSEWVNFGPQPLQCAPHAFCGTACHNERLLLCETCHLSGQYPQNWAVYEVHGTRHSCASTKRKFHVPAMQRSIRERTVMTFCNASVAFCSYRFAAHSPVVNNVHKDKRLSTSRQRQSPFYEHGNDLGTTRVTEGGNQ